MSISLSVLSCVVIEFVNESIIPVLDKNNSSFALCMQKWQELTETLMKKLSNIKTEEELKEKVRTISKLSKDQRVQKQLDDKKETLVQQRQLSGQNSQTEKNNKPRVQQTVQSKQQRQKQDPIRFRDRKISLDQNPSNRQKNEGSQLVVKKQQRSSSFHMTGMESDNMTQVPLILTSGSQVNQNPRGSYVSNPRKDTDILSFNSISDFHKSRQTIPKQTKQTPQTLTPAQQQQLKLLSKKSIQDNFTPSITQARPTCYSTNYIQSIKKINIQSRSPNSKNKLIYSQLDTSQDYVETTPLRNESMRGSVLENIKRRVSDEYVGNSPGKSGDSFGKFMNSFRRLCGTFQANHQKLLREDFTNKYINS